MKNTKQYEKKIKKMLSGVKAVKPGVYETDEQLIDLLLISILEEDTSGKKAGNAVAKIQKEFVDYNEMRVARTKEIEHCIGVNYIEVSRKARHIVTVFNNMFKKYGRITLQPLCELNKRDQKKLLQELGMSLYVSSAVALKAWSHHAIPVDWSLVGLLELNDCIEPGTGIKEVQKFLERVFNAKDDLKIHQATRLLFDDKLTQINKWRKEKLEEIEAFEKAEAERLARLEAERIAREEAEEQSEAEDVDEDLAEIEDDDEEVDEDLIDDLGAEVVADIDDEEEVPAKDEEEQPEKVEGGKAGDESEETKKTKASKTKKAAKKSTEKTVKKTTQKTAKKTAKKAVKKAAKKTVKKTAKKAAGKKSKK